ncbi:putative Lipase (Class 3) [Rubrivivax sp. A210]|uniref:hypothetical protein n=1 Tax=Rubrivivax sp. A210 TaxID=2772301 RepID=UPI00191916CE|nr:hypothetical protein [Rubrivivax sp. A210]CAD5374384.1 putative Lipase (Class 3) [Rubrivivax sp. A210]
MRALALTLSAALITGCASLEDCGGAGGTSVPKVRSSTTRMPLANISAASARFAPFAAMSALVYEEGEGCKHPRLLTTGDELRNTLARAGWSQYSPNAVKFPECDDELGMFVRVWQRKSESTTEYTIVFRGTGKGAQDWFNGNLWWFKRFLPGNDQYASSRDFAKRLIEQAERENLEDSEKGPIVFYTAGHSLGGGLAQNVLYSFPDKVSQAFAFDSSPVTAYSEQNEATRVRGCACNEAILGTEARVYRVYESQEVLSWLRYLFKLVLPLNRHIQEVRFDFNVGHSIEQLAGSMKREAGERPLGVRDDWWHGKPDQEGRDCSAVFAERLKASCSMSAPVCPR